MGVKVLSRGYIYFYITLVLVIRQLSVNEREVESCISIHSHSKGLSVRFSRRYSNGRTNLIMYNHSFSLITPGLIISVTAVMVNVVVMSGEEGW